MLHSVFFHFPKQIALGIGALLFLFSMGCSSPHEFETEVVKQLPEKIDFNFHIKPILSDRCFKCHGPDENARKAKLRLDIEERAFAALGKEKNRFAFVAGNLEKSQAYHRILSNDPEEMMPPSESNLSLSELEKAMIIRWIEQGAEWKSHWAFIPPQRPIVPKVKQVTWISNPIDHFVLSNLEENGITPSPQADKERLLRRVSFDITGLPPTIDEMDDFINDSSANAYEKVIDRLLQSPHFGERMAVEWLDLARYADSHGYQDDGMRNMWPWRDWVIKAFNANMPYDKFAIWQLAGDLLPNPTDEQLLATGFNRNHLQTQEGGVVPEEYRVEYVADRTNTTAKAFLGLTLECARCHDHKYDPISQKEFYQFYSFFNNINEYGQIPYNGEASPTVILSDEDTKAQLAFLQKKINQTDRIKDSILQASSIGFDQWVEEIKTAGLDKKDIIHGVIAHFPLEEIKDKKITNLVDRKKPANLNFGRGNEAPETITGVKGNAQKFVGESSINIGTETGRFERNQAFSISTWVKILEEKADGPLFSRSGGLFDGNRGYQCMLLEDGTLTASLFHVGPENGIQIQTRKPLPINQWVNVVMTYDGSSKAKGLKLYFDGKKTDTEILNDHLRKSILHGTNERNWTGVEHRLAIGRRFEESLEDVAIDEFILYDHCLTTLEVATINDQLENYTQTIDEEKKAELKKFYSFRKNKSFKEVIENLENAHGEENAILSSLEEVMVMKDRKFLRPTFVLNRGQYDQPTEEKVSPGTPDKVLAFEEKFPQNRLGLANWLFDANNPLTARVVVNRYWQMFFGKGIVKSIDDFGNQGDLPTHPKLLDWLATEFTASGWDMKGLIKQIAMSSTYRQSSNASAELLELDPDNDLLARGPRYRLPAEMLRDQALAVSGLLVKHIGGPSVKPYQPPGIWKELATRNATEYVQNHGDSLYRRTMYTVWKRTSPPPAMISFDVPERNLCNVKRQNTSTPLQALVLLNDPQYVEAARILAENLIQLESKTTEEKIEHSFRLLTGRKPSEKEVNTLKQLLDEELTTFQQSPEKSLELLSVGEFPRNERLDANEVAAYTVMTSTIMNFDEAVVKR